MGRWLGLGLLVLLGTSAEGRAEVVDRSASGFTTKTVVTIAATPAEVYAMLARVGEWWDPAHTYAVGGYAPGGFDTLAPLVDQVIGTQLARLKAALEK